MGCLVVFKLLTLFIYLLFSTVALASVKPIHWGTDEWPGVTTSDGTGMYHELINEIFPPESYQLSVSYFPWQRVLQSLDEQHIDMTGGLPERNKYYQSAQPVLSQRIVLVIAKEKAAAFDVDNLQQYRGSWRKGYKQDIVHHVIPPPVVGTYVDQAKQALSLIRAEKVDYYIDIEDVISRELDPDNQLFEVIQVGYFNLYWSFAHNDKGMELKHQFDQKWALLMDSGYVKRLYKKYNASFPQQRKKLLCGMSDGYPPYQYKDRRIGATGFDADVFRELLKSTKQESELLQTSWDDVVPALFYGNSVDCVLGMEVTETRKAMFDFTIPYYQRKTALFTLANNTEINSVSDLVGHKITGDKQSSLEAMLKQENLYDSIRIKHTRSKEESFRLLKSGKFIAMIAPKEVGLYLANKYNTPIRIVHEMEQGTPVAIAVKKGNTNLINMFNDLLLKAKSKKRIEALYMNWFGHGLLIE